MEVEDFRADEAKAIVQEKMENTVKLSIELVAVPQITKNFKDGH
jgi:DNA polymerase I-like protein with 3'-5' exonuclease and polymerase domains